MEWSDKKVSGKGPCCNYISPNVGCSNKQCSFGHLCPVKMATGEPCGQSHTAFKHNQILGISK